MAKEEYEEFLRGETDQISIDHDGNLLVVYASGETTCGTDWGGWHWSAEGSRDRALGRLETRLMRRNPFDVADTDWGNPGHLTGSEEDLSDEIPEGMRKLMIEHHRWYDKRQMDAVGAMTDRANRSREFER